MNPELTRRDVLKASALAAASGFLHWHIPGAKPRVVMAGDDLHENPDTIPADVNEVVMTFGMVVAATAGAVKEAGEKKMREVAFERLRRHMNSAPEVPGWIADECLLDKEYDVEPGGDHLDPLNDNRLYGLKQQWRMVRA